VSSKQHKVLSQADVEALPPFPEPAIAALKEALKGHQTLLSGILKAVRIIVKAQIGNDDKWLALSPRSQEKVLKAIFDKTRVIMKVSDTDGSQMKESTFNTYATKIKRAMIFHVRLEDANLSNAALDQAFQIALTRRGGTLEQRVTKALDELRQPGTNWVGHPPQVPTPTGGAGTTTVIQTIINMPDPRKAHSPRHLIKLGLQQFLEWAKDAEVRAALATDGDPEIKQAKAILRELRDVYEAMSEPEVEAAVA
jgi:hypothetical protein